MKEVPVECMRRVETCELRFYCAVEGALEASPVKRSCERLVH